MSDDSSQRKVEQSWEPGTLDNTRKNIGIIDKEEAARMIQVLGGEIMMEKSAPIDYSALPKREVHYSHRASGRSSSDVASLSSKNDSDSSSEKSSEKKANKAGFAVNKSKASRWDDSLPEIPAKEKNLMDKLMMSDDYRLKSNYGIFNFIRRFKKNGTEILRKGYIDYDLKNHLEHYQVFLTTVKSLIQISPDSYKAKIVNSPEPKFKFLRTAGGWTMKSLKIQLMDLQETKEDVTVAMMQPMVKSLYSDLLKIYYLGDNAIPSFFKEIYADLLKYPKADQQKLMMLSKQGITEWALNGRDFE